MKEPRFASENERSMAPRGMGGFDVCGTYSLSRSAGVLSCQVLPPSSVRYSLPRSSVMTQPLFASTRPAPKTLAVGTEIPAAVGVAETTGVPLGEAGAAGAG